MNLLEADLSWVPANWEAPSSIKAGMTTRIGGGSLPPYDTFNLAYHVGDDKDNVTQNRQRLMEVLNFPGIPVWLNQVHGNRIVDAANMTDPVADGAMTTTPGLPCVVMTADCVPLLMCNRIGNKVAAVHVGWKGLVSGILSNAIKSFNSDPDDTLVWIGPHISQEYYEVGVDVYRQCLILDKDLEIAFNKINDGHWLASLEVMIREILKKKDIIHVYSTQLCTYRDQKKFYSYRRNNTTGRMACVIWLEKN